MRWTKKSVSLFCSGIRTGSVCGANRFLLKHSLVGCLEVGHDEPEGPSASDKSTVTPGWGCLRRVHKESRLKPKGS